MFLPDRHSIYHVLQEHTHIDLRTEYGPSVVISWLRPTTLHCCSHTELKDFMVIIKYVEPKRDSRYIERLIFFSYIVMFFCYA